MSTTTTTTTQEGCAMIARNYRRYPEALERQLQLKFGRPRRHRPKEEKPQSFGGLALRQRYHPPKAMDAEQVPIGSMVRTPTGQLARVEAYRGYKRDCRVRLVCRYLDPENKRFDVVQLAPELVTVVEEA